MSRRARRQGRRDQGPVRPAVLAVLVGALVAAGLLVALVVEGLWRGQAPVTASDPEHSPAPVERPAVRSRPLLEVGDPDELGEIVDQEPAVPPWEASADNSGPVPEGHLPAWEVDPPGPDPDELMPPEPVEPPDPFTSDAPRHNPGGVDGDRPPRPLPGLDD